MFFGTGQYLTTADQLSSSLQTFYGVWDSGSGGLKRDSLVSQTLTDTAIGAYPVRTVTDNPVDYETKRGWKIDLSTGERSVTNSAAFGDLVFFNTLIPSSSTCSNGGSGWLMSVDILNGGIPEFPPLDVNGDGVFDNQDMDGTDPAVGTHSEGIPTESRFISNKRVTADSNGNVKFDNFQPITPESPNRMSWTGLER